MCYLKHEDMLDNNKDRCIDHTACLLYWLLWLELGQQHELFNVLDSFFMVSLTQFCMIYPLLSFVYVYMCNSKESTWLSETK